VVRRHPDSFVVKDGNGSGCPVHCRGDLQKWSFGHGKLTSPFAVECKTTGLEEIVNEEG